MIKVMAHWASSTSHAVKLINFESNQPDDGHAAASVQLGRGALVRVPRLVNKWMRAGGRKSAANDSLRAGRA